MNQHKEIHLLKSILDYFPGLGKLLLHKFYPYTSEQIGALADIEDLKYLSSNENIYWNRWLIDRYYEKWNLSALVKNPIAPTSEEEFLKYSNRFQFMGEFINPEVPITKEEVRRNEDNIWWDTLFKEHSYLKWLDKYYLDFLIRKKRLHEYDWLTEELLASYEEALDWNELSKKKRIGTNASWSMEFIEKYHKKLNWQYLIDNPEIKWSSEVIKTRAGRKVNWQLIFKNPNINWSIKDIKDLEEKLGERIYFSINGWSYISSNQSIDWNETLIRKYIDKWDWCALSSNSSLPFCIEFLKSFKSLWNWKALSKNSGPKWSIGLIMAFEDLWDWNELSCNTNLPFDINIIEVFEDQWNWEALSANEGANIDDELLKKYNERWNWLCLSKNKNLIWSLSAIVNYADKLSFYDLTANPKLQLTNEIILKFIDKWDWEVLSKAETIDWNYDLIEKVEKYIFWGYFSKNRSLPWSIYLMEKYINRWDWTAFYYSDYYDLPIDLEFIEKYIHNIVFTREYIYNNTFHLPDVIYDILGETVAKKFFPSISYATSQQSYNIYCGNIKERARQLLEVYKPLNSKINTEVTLLNVVYEDRYYIDGGDKIYYFLPVEFSCTTKEILKTALKLYDNKEYKEIIKILQPTRITLEEDWVKGFFIGQKYMVKGYFSEAKEKYVLTAAHPCHWHQNLL